MYTPIPDPAIWDYTPGSMPTGAMAAEPAPAPALRVSSDCIKEKQRSCWTYVSSAESVSRRVRSKELFCINFLPALPKQGILHIFQKFRHNELFAERFILFLKGGHNVPEKLKTNYVDHICIAVNDVKKAEKDYIDAFGWDVAYRYVDEPEKIRVTGFMVGPTAIEIMEDLDGTGEVAKFIRRAGEGVMLISYNVDNCEESLEVLKKNKVRLIDQKPRLFAEYNRNFAFIHPAATHGILTEIIDGKY